MGNSSSSGRSHQEETVDFGHLVPQGIYSGPLDWNQAIVAQLICDRKLAPFYRPLEDYDESWDDEQILAARKELPEGEAIQAESSSVRAESISSGTSRTGHKRTNTPKEISRFSDAALYRGAVECPICFLYYPPNINHSRCCDQAICTECFVQIKRADPTTTHLVSEPASCPYCVQENFGVVYTPPPWRTGVGSEGATPPAWPDSPKAAEGPSPQAVMKRRRKSFGHDSPEVVTIDHIRPDWEAKLAAVRAAVTRRANRRIIMRQVGDRLIPVGVTSGRVHALPAEDGQNEGVEGAGDRGSRRSRRRQQNPDINQLLGTMALGGQDLEELMVMEAMRLSLLDHEEQQRREQEEEAKKKKQQQTGSSCTESRGPEVGPSTAEAPSEPIPDNALESSIPVPALSPVSSSPGGSSYLVSPASAAVSSTGDDSSHLDTSNSGEPSTHATSSTHSHEAMAGGPSVLPACDTTVYPHDNRTSHPYSIGTALESATSAASAVTSPNPDSVSNDGTSVHSALGTAIMSATSTASAIVSPSEAEGDRPFFQSRTVVERSTFDAAEMPVGPRLLEEDNSLEHADAEPAAEAAVEDEAAGSFAEQDERDLARHGVPPMSRVDSLASSLTHQGDPYETLSSSPGSSISHKPLLDSLNSDPSVVMVADSSGVSD